MGAQRKGQITLKGVKKCSSIPKEAHVDWTLGRNTLFVLQGIRQNIPLVHHVKSRIGWGRALCRDWLRGQCDWSLGLISSQKPNQWQIYDDNPKYFTSTRLIFLHSDMLPPHPMWIKHQFQHRPCCCSEAQWGYPKEKDREFALRTLSYMSPHPVIRWRLFPTTTHLRVSSPEMCSESQYSWQQIAPPLAFDLWAWWLSDCTFQLVMKTLMIPQPQPLTLSHRLIMFPGASKGMVWSSSHSVWRKPH